MTFLNKQHHYDAGGGNTPPLTPEERAKKYANDKYQESSLDWSICYVAYLQGCQDTEAKKEAEQTNINNVLSDWLLILQENQISNKSKHATDAWKGYSPQRAVDETYKDLVAIFKHLPLKRGNQQPVIDYLKSIDSYNNVAPVEQTPSVSAEEIFKKHSDRSAFNSYQKKVIIEMMEEYATLTGNDKK